jgi:hypothetical protein
LMEYGGVCMVVYGGEWWCMVVLRWCMVVYGGVKVVYGGVKVVYGGVWWCMVVYGGNTVVYGGVWWCMELLGGVWWLHLLICRPRRRFESVSQLIATHI